MDPRKLRKDKVYGITNRKGDWYYMGYGFGGYNFSKWWHVLSTTLTKQEVINTVFEKE